MYRIVCQYYLQTLHETFMLASITIMHIDTYLDNLSVIKFPVSNHYLLCLCIHVLTSCTDSRLPSSKFLNVWTWCQCPRCMSLMMLVLSLPTFVRWRINKMKAASHWLSYRTVTHTHTTRLTMAGRNIILKNLHVIVYNFSVAEPSNVLHKLSTVWYCIIQYLFSEKVCSCQKDMARKALEQKGSRDHSK